MYYNQPINKVRDEFWTAFGRYMAPVPNVSGEHVNWVNYKTGVKFVRFVMTLTEHRAEVAIILSEPAVHQSRFLELKEMLGKECLWEQGKIYFILPSKDIRRSEDWPALISFFKEKMLLLDSVWEEVRDFF